jgi:hypothetical protein
MPESTASAVAEQLNAPEPVVTPSGDGGAPPAAAPGPAATPPFLKVNDRTSYNSAEDAIKGFTELQGRVTSLSAWEQKIAAPLEKGGFGITDPEQVAALLDELADIRAKQQGSQATPASTAASTASTVQKAAAGDKVAYESLSPEWKAHVDYLKQLGMFVTPDALRPLQEKVDALTSSNEAAYAAEVNNAVAHGTSLLESVMKETGITITPELLERVGKSVGSEIDRDSYDQSGRIIPGSLADKFLRGSEGERRAIISEQFDAVFKPFGEAFATAKTAGYVAAKATAQGTQPRTLPAGSGPASTPRTGRMTEEQRKAALGDLLGTGGFK